MRLLNKEKLKHNVERIATFDLTNNNLFGSSYFVYQNGEVVLKKHFGYASIDGKEQVDDTTIYRLASMTKPITVVAILILVDRGLISLDEPVSKYIPEFEDIHIITSDGADLGKTKTPVTILHCLTHTSGFGSDKIIAMSEDDRKTISNTVKCYINAGLDFEPFTKQAYSAFAAFDVLAAIVEYVTKQDYETFLKNEIFVPCNMLNTTFSPTEKQWKQLMMMHNKVDEKNDIGISYSGCVFERFPCEHRLAGAGLVSTLDDYSNFAQMLLNKGEINNNRIVSEQAINKLSKAYVSEKIMPGYQKWGLGVRVITDEGYPHLSVGSFGWSGAYGSHFWVDPKNDICAVFMKNSRFDGGAGNGSASRFEEAVFNALIY